MQEDELLHEPLLEESFSQRYFGTTWPKLLAALLLVMLLGLYIQSLLFGNRSLAVLLQLDEYETYLKEQIHTLKEQNAALQKEYFELRELDADTH